MGGIQAAQQEDLHLAPCLGTVANQAGRQHTCIVEDKGITGHQKFLEVIEMLVQDSLVLGVQHHETGSIARLNGSLGNALLRQVVVKI